MTPRQTCENIHCKKRAAADSTYCDRCLRRVPKVTRRYVSKKRSPTR